MPRRPRRQRTSVRLTGIALRQQGSNDSLCAYYAAAMLVGALRPELEEQFEAAHVGDDPLFGNLPRPAGRSLEQAVAEWLTAGVSLPALCRALNRACERAGRVRTRFRYRRTGPGAEEVAFLRGQIDLGLPCLLGWESGEMGNHTSLVVGYDRHAGSRSQWLRLLDPIRMQDVLEWGQLGRARTRQVELIWCAAHDGVRPDKLTTERDGHGALLPGRTRLERWNPREGRYQDILA